MTIGDSMEKICDEFERIEKGSGTPNSVKVGSVTLQQVEEIAKVKMEDLNANTLGAAVKIISGSARSMGITVES